MPTVHQNSSGRRRLHLGGICDDNFLTVPTLERGRKHTILDRFSSTGAGAGNSAIGHRRLAPDRRVILLAGVGDDLDGDGLRRRMAAEGIEMPWPPIPGMTTSVSFAIVERDTGTTTPLSETGARAVPIPWNLIEQAMPGAEACCLVAHAVNEQIEPIVACAARYGVPLFLGLGRTQIEQLGYAGLQKALVEPIELIICNRLEAEHLTGRKDTAEQREALRFGGRVQTVVITAGPDGIHALRDGPPCSVLAYRDHRPVVDDVGAGDAAQAAIVDALLKGYPLELALRAGARQGFEACTGFGATTNLIDGEAMRDYLSRWQQGRGSGSQD